MRSENLVLLGSFILNACTANVEGRLGRGAAVAVCQRDRWQTTCVGAGANHLPPGGELESSWWYSQYPHDQPRRYQSIMPPP